MGRGAAQAAAAAAAAADVPSIPSSASSGLASGRRFISKIKLTRLPYHRLDEIHEEEEIGGDDPVDLFQSYIEEEEEEEEEEEQEEEQKGEEVSRAQEQQQHQRSKTRRMFTRSSSSNSWRVPLRVGSTGYHARRRSRWRRMRLRICSRVRWSWLSPLEFLKKLRRAYIQAMIGLSTKESQCGIVLLSSPWSFPVVVPFRSGMC